MGEGGGGMSEDRLEMLGEGLDAQELVVLVVELVLLGDAVQEAAGGGVVADRTDGVGLQVHRADDVRLKLSLGLAQTLTTGSVGTRQ